MQILLVYDNDPSLSALLQEQLEGWQVKTVFTVADIVLTPARAVLLAADGDHKAIADALRQAGMIGPLFSLAEGATSPLIPLARPLRLATLMAKLETPNGSAVDGAMIGKWRLDSTQRALVDNDRLEYLTDKEFSLLTVLLISGPETVDAKRLQSEIWRYHPEADTHTVETHVWRLRQKLEIDPANPELLLTGSDGYFIKST